jgi:hypothetical protein
LHIAHAGQRRAAADGFQCPLQDPGAGLRGEQQDAKAEASEQQDGRERAQDDPVQEQRAR